MVSEMDATEALVITPDMLVHMPTKGHEAKTKKITFEKNMSVIPFFVLIIMILNVISYIVEISTGALVTEQAILRAGALNGDLVLQGEYWRLISAEFLHGSSSHLVGNLIVLYILGMATEHAFGMTRTIAIYFCSAVTASLLSMTMGSGISVGASGAIFGLMGALIVYFRKNSHEFNLRDGNIGIFIAIIAVIQIALGFTAHSHIDNYAHIGGFLGGVLLALLLKSHLSIDDMPLSGMSHFFKVGTLLSFLAVSMIWLLLQGHIYLLIAQSVQMSHSLEKNNMAIHYASRSLLRNPHNHNAYIVRATAYGAAKKYDSAIKDGQTYIALYPNDTIGYSVLGEISNSKKDYSAASEYYSSAIHIQPDPNLYNGRGYNKILMGDYTTSRDDFQSAIALNDKYAPAYGNLGLLDAIDGSYESAIQQLEKSYALDPSLETIKDLIAALKAEKKGDYHSAMTLYQSFITKTKDSRQWQAENEFAMQQLTMIKSENK